MVLAVDERDVGRDATQPGGHGESAEARTNDNDSRFSIVSHCLI
jgi:hypothetical protein